MCLRYGATRCGDDATWPGCGRWVRAPGTGPGETSSFYFSHRYSSRHEYSGCADRPRVIRGLFYRIKDLFYPFRQVGNVKGLGDVIENTVFDPGGDIVLRRPLAESMITGMPLVRLSSCISLRTWKPPKILVCNQVFALPNLSEYLNGTQSDSNPYQTLYTAAPSRPKSFLATVVRLTRLFHLRMLEPYMCLYCLKIY